MCFVVTLHIQAQDLIIFRNGTEIACKVDHADAEKTYIVNLSDAGKLVDTLPNSDIYMVKYRTRGNVFYTTDGSFITNGETAKPDRNATLVYLVSGMELSASQVTMNAGYVFLHMGKGKNVQTRSLPKSQVFMIKYPDGTKDIINSAMPTKTVSEPEQPAKQSPYPANATITTITDNAIKAVVLGEDHKYIAFRRDSPDSGIIYFISKKKIKEVYTNP